MNHGEWSKWDGLWYVKWTGWILMCEYNKDEQRNNMNTTEVERTLATTEAIA